MNGIIIIRSILIRFVYLEFNLRGGSGYDSNDFLFERLIFRLERKLVRFDSKFEREKTVCSPTLRKIFL